MIRLVARVNARDLELHRDLARALDLALDLAVHRNRDLARGLARALDSARARALTGDRALTRALARGLTDDRAFDRARALARDIDLDRTHALADTLARARDIARALVDLDSASHGARAAVVAGGTRSMPGRVSRGLVALAVRMLPAAQRPRYRAEFRAELLELPRRERLVYSLRVLVGAWELRRALVEAVCTPDGAAARRAER